MRRRFLSVLVAGGLMLGPLAAPAAANDDPVREAFCRLAEKMGVVWVQGCDLH